MRDKKGTKKSQSRSEHPAPEVDLGQLEKLLSFMEEHELEEFEYAHHGLHIRLKKAGASLNLPPGCAPPMTPGPGSTYGAAPLAGSSEKAPHARPVAEEFHIIKSPIVGTYYSAPGPDAAPFVHVGDVVKAGQTVCIIEAMKLMNEIEADIAGEIARVLVENGQPVDYGKPLFAVRPAGTKK